MRNNCIEYLITQTQLQLLVQANIFDNKQQSWNRAANRFCIVRYNVHVMLNDFYCIPIVHSICLSAISTHRNCNFMPYLNPIYATCWHSS